MESNLITLTDIFPYIKVMCNIISFGVGTITGGLIIGGFIIGYNNNY